MKYLWLLWSNLKRKKLRTFFTLASITVAFFLFGLLGALRTAFTAGVDIAGVDRLMVTHKLSIIQPLPRAYFNRIAAIEGVQAVTHATWFGGYYQEPRNAIVAFPVEPETYLEMYAEWLLPQEQRQRWLANRTGMVAGRDLADKYGWQLGDKIPIRSEIYRRDDGSNTWEFTLDGIYTVANNEGDQSTLLMHYEYFNETQTFQKDNVGWYVVRVTDPDQAPAIAGAIDARFANSSTETKTATEKAFAQGFANQVGNIAAIVSAVVTAVFFTMLLVTTNTMAQSVRERTRELAVLKTLGFSGASLTVLVLAESLLITAVGGLLGLALAYGLIQGAGDAFRRMLAVFYLPASDVVAGVGFIVLFGFLAGALPAAQALRLRIVDALRRT